ncbi:phage major capsid protein [Ruegeria marisrubri]|uniref:phage major capsid protein n=1 Tax=Ruegeria marisrubri TaxID=1685379 RepID=UPI001CD59514|nr:phage major capsid protein [Ruegeria marisrubri]MCA0905142.1 phage major capsid protein [Ruegeria marisrubri]
MKGMNKATALVVAGSVAASALIGQAFTRSVTAEQINNNNGNGPLRRNAEVRNIDTDARTVEVAFSSETPVLRWFGDEILDHSPGAMLTERLDNGAAVLWNHNSDVQIGVVESARIDGDRIGRAVLRFGRSDRAEQIWNDIVDGVIRHISVGYFVKAVKTEEREGETDKVTITEWEPYEISLVSIPADPSVGVGRSVGEPPEEPENQRGNTASQTRANETEGSGNMNIQILRNAAGDLVRAEVDENGNIVKELEVLERAADTQALVTRGQQREQTRVAALMEIGEQYSAQSLVNDAVRNGTSVDEFTRTVLDHVHGNNENNSRGNQALSDDAGVVGLTDGEADGFSFVRALRALANPNDRAAQEAAGFEFEASRAAEQSSVRAAQGIMVPADVLRRALNTSTTGTAAGDTGGHSIATDLMAQSFIGLLRNRSVLLGMATPMAGLEGNVDIPGQATGANAFWLGEDDDTTETGAELRMLGLSPKTLGAYTEVTRKMLQQSSLDVEAWLRRELAIAVALKADKTGFYGTGTGNEPLGIKNIPGINSVAFTAVQPTFAELVQLESEIAADNADVNTMAYIGNAAFRGHCKTAQKFAGTNGATIWEQGNTVNGYRTEITQQVATGDVFHGNFSDMVAAMWGGLDLTVDPYTHSKKGRVRIVAFQDFDFAYRHVESFAYGKKP